MRAGAWQWGPRRRSKRRLEGPALHELWLRDPSGYGIEVYARLTPEELATMPADQEPNYLVPGTEPAAARGTPSSP